MSLKSLTVFYFICCFMLFNTCLFAGSLDLTKKYSTVIKNGMIIDGSGSKPYSGMVVIENELIAYVGPSLNIKSDHVIDAKGMAISPGFINMLSWSAEPLIKDGASLGNLKQGVTLEVFGEGSSMGPLNDEMKKKLKKNQSPAWIAYDIEWTTLTEFLAYLEKKGISTNVASFVGAATLRVHAMGNTDRVATKKELNLMKMLLETEMKNGAMGLGSALEYVPGTYMTSFELIELAKVVSKYDGLYTSHLRNEGDYLIESVDEFISITKQAKTRSDIYHLKASGIQNHHKLDLVIDKINHARNHNIDIGTNMYTYTAASTSLTLILPSWIKKGSLNDWITALKDPINKTKVKDYITLQAEQFVGGFDGIVVAALRNSKLQSNVGKSILDIARAEGRTPADIVINLIIEDSSKVQVIYHSMTEDNLIKKIKLPYMSFGSDASSYPIEYPFTKYKTHPRAYGNFARLLAKYVREENVISLEEAIYKLTLLPASRLKLHRRGLLKESYFADIVIFDPSTIKDHATFQNPHQYASGVHHVFVNGTAVIKDKKHTNLSPGKFIKGPGFFKKNKS
ncbi:MAG: aminoacylase [Rickettsiales bacterium]|nr:aminoacylase [Rickettsiales bacterium]